MSSLYYKDDTGQWKRLDLGIPIDGVSGQILTKTEDGTSWKDITFWFATDEEFKTYLGIA